MKSVTKCFLSFLVLACAFLFVRPSLAQQTQASLTGQISDPQGATIPNAEVSIKNVDTAITRTVATNGLGRYSVTNLNPGNYAVSVKAPGFSEKLLKGIVLAVGQEGSLDVAMTLGAASDVVTVNAEAAVTDTESSSQGSVINNQEVVGLPLNQRTFYGLALLSPAAYMPGQNSTLGFRGGFNVSGNNETANTFTVNGIDDNDQNVMAPSFRPSVEAIDQFKLLTGVYSAEYGRTSGGQVVVITKTGTNAFHGDVFEFIRNSQFDAKNYFTIPNTPTTLIRNQFGATIGGPIIKDKTFFFFSYEGMRLKQPVASTTTVPNPAMLNGDFSSVCTTGFTSAGICTTASQQLHAPGNSASPYLFNKIPTSSMSAKGLALLKLYPAPSPGYSTATATPGYTFDEERTENLDQYSVRVDHKISDKDSLLVQFNRFNDPSFEPQNSLCGTSQIPGFGCTTNQISTLAGVNWIHIVNERWLNEFRIGYDRLEQPRTGEDVNNAAANAASLGTAAFSDSTVSSAINGGAPTTTVSGIATLHPYQNLPQHRWDNHYNMVDNVSWSHGKHNVKFGVNMLQARYTDVYVALGTGSLTFSTSNLLSTGNTIADLYTGEAYQSSRSPKAPNFQAQYSYYGGYLQDDWKVLPTLTLNVGLRYEYFAPTFDAHNVMASYELPAGFVGRTRQNSAGTMAVAGQNGIGKYLYGKDLNNFAPRLGFAYQPFGNDKTVVHGTYGVFYNAPAIGNGANLDMSINPPFRLNQTFTSTVAAPIQIDNSPFPSGTADGSFAHPFTSVAPYGIGQNFKTQYMNEWGLDVQRQVTPTMTLTVGYIGSETAKIARQVQPNQEIITGIVNGKAIGYAPLTNVGPPTVSAGGVVTPAATLNPIGPVNAAGAYAVGPTGSSTLNGQYYQISNPTLFLSVGHASFNALTVKAQQNYHNGFSFILAYTWAHSIDNAPGYASGSNSSNGTPQDSFNLQAEKGTSDFNVGSRLVISPVYELPFGKGKPFLTNGIAGLLAGGWQLSGIFSYDTGRPFTIQMATNNSGSTNGGADRPNVIANPNNGPKTVAQWFNTAAFTANAVGQFGNESRNALIGPNYDNTDVAIQRMFDVTERYKFAFRAEAFDVFNHPNFYNPLGTSTGEFGQSNFGKLTQANDPRSMQFSVKVLF
ncbi:TonB-dependent receptor [Granulicella sp. WH15]|uniref:TonB-dependent receptor n=1 Tax=Granulicella sp. WH15 TaxID=2602070 RepID=UPI0013A5AD76|nr:TonB-dependent receptor [Granulicella sp. WH15]